eukprot:TRINITY_DN21706_c0_g1_i2.p1 TRINITY_DN21706_c0_g1~~TRINITY_DN21706_c0_g1_i2.p1  ORF type:complete len:268 (+),score=10.79 TRINITY_DN21706_c0_g1_i2:58-861(+)
MYPPALRRSFHGFVIFTVAIVILRSSVDCFVAESRIQPMTGKYMRRQHRSRRHYFAASQRQSLLLHPRRCSGGRCQTIRHVAIDDAPALPRVHLGSDLCKVIGNFFRTTTRELCDSPLVDDQLSSSCDLLRSSKTRPGVHEYWGVKRLFWRLYREQAHSGSEKSTGVHQERTITIRSALGVQRRLDLRDFSNLIIAQMARTASAREGVGGERDGPAESFSDYIADIRAAASGVVFLITVEHVASQSSKGLLLCGRCGDFFRGEKGSP